MDFILYNRKIGFNKNRGELFIIETAISNNWSITKGYQITANGLVMGFVGVFIH